MYVWPCIIYENDERYQLDAKIVIYQHKYLYMFRASYLRHTPQPPPHTTHTTPLAPLYSHLLQGAYTYHVGPEPDTPYNITETNNYTTRPTTQNETHH